MNCPYKWTNSTDEEDDQTSSWESEPAGENAEELASLETPDEEGEWRAESTGAEGEFTSRPALHHLTEDDEGERVSGGLNHLVPRHAGGAQCTWKKVTVVVDSGAAKNVMLRSMFSEIGRCTRHQTDHNEEGTTCSQRCANERHRATRSKE